MRRIHWIGSTGVCCLALVLLLPGCSRTWYREKVDDDVTAIITDKNRFEAWEVEQFHVYPDPRARFADPANPDFPPKPPDDPAAEMLSPNPQPAGKAGVGYFEGDIYLKLLAAWDRLNRAEVAEQEAERAREERADRSLTKSDEKTGEAPAEPADPVVPNPADPVVPNPAEADPSIAAAENVLKSDEPQFLIKLPQASELALFNSREFQTQRENLYLAALPVSLQRFAFAAQFFATEQAIREQSGSLTGGGRQNLWTANTNVGFSKLFPTGALLLFRFANQLVIDLGRPSGSGREIGISNLTLGLTQPLLRGGGKAVNLEALTQAERDLVYAIRTYARFRKIFAVGIATGDMSAGPGYLPTLLTASGLRISEQNLQTRDRTVELFRALSEVGQANQVQLGQNELSALDARVTLLNAQQGLQSSLDSFKLQLGVPPGVGLELDQSPIREIERQLDRYQDVIDAFTAFDALAAELSGVAPAEMRQAVLNLVATAPVTRGTDFRTEFPKRLAEVSGLTLADLNQRLTEKRRREVELLDERTEVLREGRPVPDALDAELKSVSQEIDYADLERLLRLYEQESWNLRPEAERQQAKALGFRSLRDTLANVVTEARSEQFQQVRDAWPELPPVELDGEDLLEADLDTAYTLTARQALRNRFDLMNARGQLVDAWRNIAVQANSLLGVIDVGYNLSSSTPQGLNRPFAFSGSRTTHQLTFNGELPLVRRAERNAYRAGLIAYQQQRRLLQSTEDSILISIRSQLRSLRVQAQQYRIQQQSVELAYQNLENAQLEFIAPPEPGQQVDVAGLTQQLLSALDQLPRAQNDLYRTWISYQITRQQLFRDLELMPLDSRGVWIDGNATHRDNAESEIPAGTPLPNGSAPGRGLGAGSGALPSPRPVVGPEAGLN